MAPASAAADEDPAFYTDIRFGRWRADRGLARQRYQRQQTFNEFGGLRIPLELVWLPANGGDVELIVPARGLDVRTAVDQTVFSCIRTAA
jgi:hypothetical protein